MIKPILATLVLCQFVNASPLCADFIDSALRFPNEWAHEINCALISNGFKGFDRNDIEFSGAVYNPETKEKYIYYDLVDNYGYIVVDSKRHIKSVKYDCDCPKIRESKDAVFYQNGCFFTKHEFYEINRKQNTGKTETSNANNPNSYAATYIEYGGLPNYLYGRYSVSFSLSSYNKLSNLNAYDSTLAFFGQLGESVYMAGPFSEGNCSLVATANAMGYCREYKAYSNLPSVNSNSAVFAQTESIYSSAVTTSVFDSISQQTYYYYPVSTPAIIHSLYSQIRSEAISLGYVCDGFVNSNMPSLVENSFASSNYIVDSSYVSSVSQSTFINEIDADRPVLLVMGEDDKYKNHIVMATGYRIYSGVKRLNNHFYIDVEVFCLSIWDGHSLNERWYDADLISTVLPSEGSRSSWINAVKIEV